MQAVDWEDGKDHKAYLDLGMNHDRTVFWGSHRESSRPGRRKWEEGFHLRGWRWEQADYEVVGLRE